MSYSDFYEGLGKHQEERIAPLIPAGECPTVVMFSWPQGPNDVPSCLSLYQARLPCQEPQLFGLEAEIDTYSDAKITCTTLSPIKVVQVFLASGQLAQPH
jgi:hypothetical protein